MKTKLLCICGALAMLLTACGGGGEPDSSAESSSTPAVGNTTTSTSATSGSEGDSTTSAAPSGTTGSTTTSKTDEGDKPMTTTTTTQKPVSTTTVTTATVSTADDTVYTKFRNGLNNTYVKLTRDKKLTIAYIGGSITAGAGAGDPTTASYRALTTKWFKEKFPDATITEINMGAGSAGSKLAAYYTKTELAPKKPDLIFMEFAINDYYERELASIEDVAAQYETIIRQLRLANPNCEFVALYTTDDEVSITEQYFSHAKVQDEVAAYYGIPSVNIGRQLRMQAGLKTPKVNGVYTDAWKKLFADNVHPTAQGHKLYATYIGNFLNTALLKNAAAKKPTLTAYTMPAEKNDDLLMDAEYIKTETLDISSFTGWKYGATAGIYSETTDAELTVTFTGTALHFRCSGLTWDNVTRASYSVDGGDWKILSPKMIQEVPIVTGLTAGKHTVRFRCGYATTAKPFSITALMIRK